jgi:LacI family transcriptional regulator
MGSSEQRSRISMRDLAKEVGVSVSAVSLGLRNSPKVSKEKRDEIHRAADRIGYVKDGRVTELMEHLRSYRKLEQMSTIAVLILDVRKSDLKLYPRIQAFLAGVEAEAKGNGYGVDVMFLVDLGVSPKRLRNILIARGIKGVVVMPFQTGVGKLDLDISGFCVSTPGYSIIDPMLNRSCPDYLQMMDELIEQICRLGYKRVGFIMTYGSGGVGHKLYSSSFLYYSAQIDGSLRIPILRRREIQTEGVERWMKKYKPDVVISSGKIYRVLEGLGYNIPDDLGFASLEILEDHKKASGVDHRHELVGSEALKLTFSDINLNNSGIPENPKVVLVDSHFRPGNTLNKVGRAREVKLRATK